MLPGHDTARNNMARAAMAKMNINTRQITGQHCGQVSKKAETGIITAVELLIGIIYRGVFHPQFFSD